MKKTVMIVLMCCSISMIDGMMGAAREGGSRVTHYGFRLFPNAVAVIAAGYFWSDAVSDLAKAQADKIRAEADAIRATSVQKKQGPSSNS